MSEPAPKAASPSLWRSVRTVAWSFLGIRRNAEFKQDLAQVNPLHIIAIVLAAQTLWLKSRNR